MLVKLKFIVDLQLELRAAKPTFLDLKERNGNEFRHIDRAAWSDILTRSNKACKKHI